MKLKILCYNVHKLFNITGTRYFLSTLKEILGDMDLDIVFLQEVPGFLHQKIMEEYDSDPLEHLADEIWDHFVYGKNAIYNNGNHGNAILSKFPFGYSKNFDISNHALEQRGLLLGKIQTQSANLMLGCTHLDLTFLGRKNQVQKMDQIIKDHSQPDSPFIFCGDFNDWNGQTSELIHQMGLKSMVGKILRTFPSFYPVLPLDRIFFRNIECETVHVLTDNHWKKLSDHLPLYAEFKMEPVK